MQQVTLREIILFGTSLILAYFLFVKGCNNSIDKSKYIPKEMFDAANDSLHKTINSFGQETSQTKLLTGTVNDLTKLASSKDSSIQRLLKLVNKKTIGATIVSTSTSSTVTGHTTVNAKDTIKGKDSLIYIYPEYVLKPTVTQWDSVTATANKDTIKVTYTVFNKFDITQKFEKQKIKGKLFKQNVPMVSIVNLNPHTQTKEFKSFIVDNPKPKRGISTIAGILIGIVAGEYLAHKF